MAENSFSRRTFIGGVAAGGVLLSAAPILKLSKAQAVWPPTPNDILFDQNFLTNDASLHLSGLRRDQLATGGYLNPARIKAQIAAGSPLRAEFPGVNAALVGPVANTVPRDEWTITLDILNDTAVDYPSVPLPQAQVFFIASGLMFWRATANKVALTNFNTGQGVELTIPAGAWPGGTWQTFTLWYRRSDTTLWVMRGTDYAGRGIGGPPSGAPPLGWPLIGSDDGMQIGGSTGTQPFDIGNTKIHRYFWPYDSNEIKDPAKVTVNAATTQGVWPNGLSGVLGLYQGFHLIPETPASIAVRNQQLTQVFDQAGSKHVRFAGLMGYPTITPNGPNNFTYNWTNLDAKVDALLNGRPNLKLHVSLDYCPTILMPAGGDWRSPPTNFTKWAQIASDIVGHMKTRYGTKFASCTLWNEPDLGNYWTGTQAQLYSLWSTTQTKLIATHPDKKMGSPEFAYTAGFQGFFSWLAGQSSTLKNSLTALYMHDFQQDLYRLRERMLALRTAANNAGVPSTIPIRITEYNLNLAQLVERVTDANSWYTTQPEHFMNEYAAAYPIHYLWEALDQDPKLDVATFAAIGCQELYWGKQAIVSSTGTVVPYGPWSTIALLSKLSGNRISAVSNWPSVKALAAKTATNGVTLVYANFKPTRGFIDDLTFQIQWSGLKSTYTWTHWQYDKDTQSGGKMVVVGTGNQTNLPTSVTMGALGVGGIQIV